MPHLICPHCQATFRTGLLYASHEACPRCGRPLFAPRPSRREQFTSAVFRRRQHAEDAIDWELITNSQYAGRQYVSRSEHEAPFDDRTLA